MSTGDQGWSSPSDNSSSTHNSNPYNALEDSSALNNAPQYGQYGAAAPGQPAPLSATAQAYPFPPSGPNGQYGQYGSVQSAAVPTGFIMAPKPGIIPLRPLNMGEIFEGAFSAIRVNPRTMFFTSFIVMAISGVLTALASYFLTGTFYTAINPAATDTSDIGAASVAASSLPQAFFSFFAATILSGLLIVAVSRAVLGRIADIGYVWQRTKRKVWALLGESLLTGFLTGLSFILVSIVTVGLLASIGSNTNSTDTGTVLAVVFAILILIILSVIVASFLAIKFSLAPTALVLEDLGVFESMSRSWALTKGQFWRLFGILFLTMLIAGTAAGLLSGVVSMISQIFTTAAPSSAPYSAAIAAFLSSLVQALIVPFVTAVSALLYIDVRMRKEGLDVELRRAADMG